MGGRVDFYRENISRWMPERGASVLIVAGGKKDRDVFHSLGFTNVTISNLASYADDEIAPYGWSRQDLENLTYQDREFDYVVVHAGLHHCRSPHRGLLEMYRVARRAIVAFDPADNFAIRVMQKLGLAQVYECVAVEDHGAQSGGVNNSQIPNFIYRWTEREVKKTINSAGPVGAHRFHFAYGSDEPAPKYSRKSRLKWLLVRILKPAYRCFTFFFRSQGNLFGFMVEKPVLPRDLHPWLAMEGQEVKFVHEGTRTPTGKK